MIRDLLTEYQSVTYVCDKRFLLILMFCDYAVEPWYYERGHNFYEDGQNYAMASLLAIAGPALLGKSQFSALLAAFQRATRDKSAGSLRELVSLPPAELIGGSFPRRSVRSRGMPHRNASRRSPIPA